ncbi:hypothetical protein OG616_10835 [Streptomyces antibioticus]|uniref:hypothetical protein n=1 Tax=Streptomyces antibioticus TaxID=1890 RepID=UPI0022519146|nr:hypothetical protein [Streptomyces antibioticus]MCX5168513.1 hypothetical protein [Streptomyces antibioticus]
MATPRPADGPGAGPGGPTTYGYADRKPADHSQEQPALIPGRARRPRVGRCD